MKNNKAWSIEEIELLKNNYSNKGPLYCSTILNNRTITAIRKKANYLKLTKVYHKIIYGYDILIEHIKNSKSISEVLTKLNLRHAGGNYKTIKNYINLYKIDTNHFETIKERNNRAIRKYDLNINELFCDNSKISRGTIKRYIFKYNLKQNICELCGQDENWKGKKITLILDHKNGIFNDNRLENLQIVCPNCNATLDTHCGKNVKLK